MGGRAREGGRAGGLEPLGNAEWSRVRIPRSEMGIEPAERILKLVFGRELCTHDSWFSRAGMTERCL